LLRDEVERARALEAGRVDGAKTGGARARAAAGGV
jgi:hypothetical protein